MSEIDGQHLRLLEAVLFSSAEPLTEKALAERMPDGADLPTLLAELGDVYANRGINLIQAGKAWAFRTASDLASQLAHQRQKVRKLGRAMIESLSVIAYHQPVTRAEVEEIRGVGFNRGTLDALFEAGWIHPVGRRRTPGRPVTWGTTDIFLDHFGLESLSNLPGIEELKAAGLLDKRPAIEAYAVEGRVLSADEAENAEDNGNEPSLFSGIEIEEVQEPLEIDEDEPYPVEP